MNDPLKENEGGTCTIEEQETDTRTKTPKLYKVLLHNDDVNDFIHVIKSVQQVFKYEHDKCAEIVIEAHTKGLALCKIEPLETAELHQEQLQSFRLTSTIEPE